MSLIIKKTAPVLVELTEFYPGCEIKDSILTKEYLGGKGANLAIMATLGYPVPSGFTIPCHVSVDFKKTHGNVPRRLALLNQVATKVERGMSHLQEQFGYMPLVSVRSGARVSMPGMMDTILNVGLTTETLPFWMEKLGPRAALDSYRRLIQM